MSVKVQAFWHAMICDAPKLYDSVWSCPKVWDISCQDSLEFKEQQNFSLIPTLYKSVMCVKKQKKELKELRYIKRGWSNKTKFSKESSICLFWFVFFLIWDIRTKNNFVFSISGSTRYREKSICYSSGFPKIVTSQIWIIILVSKLLWNELLLRSCLWPLLSTELSPQIVINLYREFSEFPWSHSTIKFRMIVLFKQTQSLQLCTFIHSQKTSHIEVDILWKIIGKHCNFLTTHKFTL